MRSGTTPTEGREAAKLAMRAKCLLLDSKGDVVGF
jgi:hypothetical protein